MNVASLEFLAFGLAAAVLYNLLQSLWWRQLVLIVANLAFLSTFTHSISAWIPYVCFLVFGYLGYLRARSKTSRGFGFVILSVLVVFFWLKKYTFLPERTFLQFPYTVLGMSYVLFRILHLLIDTHDGVIAEYVDPLSFLNYALNFTAIISGPIQRFQDYAAMQLREDRPLLDFTMAGEAIERIVIGFFKIRLLGLVCETVQLRCLAALPHMPGHSLTDRTLSAAAIFVSYTLYLYFNFSGYTDIVIGAARGIRLTLPENFDAPFSSTSFLEFWSRWHITLSNWLKTYVYSPLLKTLMQRFPTANLIPYWGVLSFFVTFFLVGVWHGRTSVFIVFGILQGLGVSLNKLYQIQINSWLGKKKYRELSNSAWYDSLARGLTFTYFAFTLIWFWSNWEQMGAIVANLHWDALITCWLWIFAASTIILSAFTAVRLRAQSVPALRSRYIRVIWGSALLTAMVVFLETLSGPAPDIIYRAF